jgi:hypothetical protein
MWWKILLYVILGLAAIIAVVLVYGSRRWQSATKEIHAKLEEAHLPIKTTRYDVKELNDLPAPVRRYFRSVLKDGQPIISVVGLEQSGTFNLSETDDQWKPFTATQKVITNRPGFDWEAQIKMAPLVAVSVHDAYVAGEGILNASLFGLVTLTSLRGTQEVAQGELMRYLAEAAWYPTALLPSQGVRWEAVDDNSAKATLKDDETRVTILLRFNKENLIESVSAERPRMVGGKIIPTQWEGRWSHYEIRDGMRVPLEGEVAWILPEGRKTYWRGRITNLSYEFAQ